jgi:hypothetical protein
MPCFPSPKKTPAEKAVAGVIAKKELIVIAQPKAVAAIWLKRSVLNTDFDDPLRCVPEPLFSLSSGVLHFHAFCC